MRICAAPAARFVRPACPIRGSHGMAQRLRRRAISARISAGWKNTAPPILTGLRCPAAIQRRSVLSPRPKVAHRSSMPRSGSMASAACGWPSSGISVAVEGGTGGDRRSAIAGETGAGERGCIHDGTVRSVGRAPEVIARGLGGQNPDDAPQRCARGGISSAAGDRLVLAARTRRNVWLSTHRELQCARSMPGFKTSGVRECRNF